MLLELRLKLEKHCLKKHHDGVEALFYPSAQLTQPLTKIQRSALKRGKMLALLVWVTRTVLLYKIFLTTFLYIKRNFVDIQKRENVSYYCGIFNSSKKDNHFSILRYVRGYLKVSY